MDFERYTVKYKTQKFSNNQRILGKEFVKNNRNKGILLIKHKKYKINEYIEINNISKVNEFKIDLIFCKNHYNKSFMFYNCASLLEFSIIEKNSEQEEEDENELKEQKELIFEQFAIGYKNISPNTNSENSTFTYYSNISKEENNNSDNSTLMYFYDYLAKETNYYGIFKGLFNNCRSL